MQSWPTLTVCTFYAGITHQRFFISLVLDYSMYRSLVSIALLWTFSISSVLLFTVRCYAKLT